MRDRRRRRNECRPRRTRRSVRVFTALLACLAALTFFEEERIVPEAVFYHPTKEVRRLIDASAERYSLSRELLQSVILTESKFDNHAVSSTGAVGIMQLMPDTAAWIAEQSGLPADNLHNPEENIPLGAWYLEYLIGKYDGNLVLALAAYNAGRGNVDSWMEERGWPADYADIDGIPFPETREFVRSVIENRDWMKGQNEEER